KDGYPMRSDGCTIACLFDNDFCNRKCVEQKGKSGYCYFWKQSCYCEGLPDDKVYDSATSKCRA
uniref:Beta-toxin NaTx36 n=1 Tax=Centruroides sculpturatus TaxID=218467 RepID=SCX36_CENSC